MRNPQYVMARYRNPKEFDLAIKKITKYLEGQPENVGCRIKNPNEDYRHITNFCLYSENDGGSIYGINYEEFKEDAASKVYNFTYKELKIQNAIKLHRYLASN